MEMFTAWRNVVDIVNPYISKFIGIVKKKKKLRVSVGVAFKCELNAQ